jgi:uncharacterized protein YbdZ (MbtH family)
MTITMTLEQKFHEWLQENKAFLVVAIRTPQGELIKPENFIPAGWSVVVGVNEAKREIENDSQFSNSK